MEKNNREKYNREKYNIKVLDTRPNASIKCLTHRYLHKWEVEYISFHPGLKIISIEKSNTRYRRNKNAQNSNT